MDNMAASVECLLEALDRDREIASSSEGITEDVRSSSGCTSDIESSPLVCGNLSGMLEDWEAPPLLDMHPRDARQKKQSFFTMENISSSLISPKRDVRQVSASTDSMGSPPELVPVPNTPPLVPVSCPPTSMPQMGNVMQQGANQFAARRVPSFRGARPVPMNTPACTPQQLAELENDELRRQMVAAQQVQLHAARSQLACMVAQQAPVQEGVMGQSSMGQSVVSKQEFDMNKVDPELYKVKMCRNMNKHGVCPYATQCVFAHSPNELRSRETNLDVLKRLYDACKPTVNPLKYKVNSCQKFEELGFCPYEPHCVFAHGPPELRTVQNNLQAIHRIQHICQTTGITFIPSS